MNAFSLSLCLLLITYHKGIIEAENDPIYWNMLTEENGYFKSVDNTAPFVFK